MKKIIAFILMMTLVVVIGSSVYAAPGDPAQNVDTETYNQPPFEIPEDEVPGGAATTDIRGETLPKTGGMPAETFYVAGGLLIAAALVISFRKTAKG